MEKTTIHLHTEFKIGPVDPRIFGGFLEHLGRAVYEGIYDPQSTHADADGCRSDVLDALRPLAMTSIRYPGGNFASGYHWLDGVGPRQTRPTARDLAWQSIEPNYFGTDEFMHLTQKMGWIPMLTVNLGTGTPEEARNWVEYCNCLPGTRYADLRAANGSPQPFAVPLWCLGNEMDGPWQLGHVPADQYAIRAQQAAKMMKDTDKSIELVVCGSCIRGISTYMEWDRVVLEHLGDLADYISLHSYASNRNGNTADFLAYGNTIDRQIEEMDAICSAVQAKRGSKKRTLLCFDEWNVWYKNTYADGAGQFAPPLLEEIYNLEDALVVAGYLHSFVRHADVLKIANLAQIVNVIAPILTRGDDLLIQSIFYPFAMFSQRRSGVSLRCAVNGPGYDSPTHGFAHYIDASAIHGDDQLHVFITNRSLDETAEVDIKLTGREILSFANAELFTGPNAKSVNSFEDAQVVIAKPFGVVTLTAGEAYFKLPPLSFVAITLNLK